MADCNVFKKPLNCKGFEIYFTNGVSGCFLSPF